MLGLSTEHLYLTSDAKTTYLPTLPFFVEPPENRDANRVKFVQSPPRKQAFSLFWGCSWLGWGIPRAVAKISRIQDGWQVRIRIRLLFVLKSSQHAFQGEEYLIPAPTLA